MDISEKPDMGIKIVEHHNAYYGDDCWKKTLTTKLVNGRIEIYITRDSGNGCAMCLDRESIEQLIENLTKLCQRI